MKNTILYLECASGISGDMTVAALLDLGADRKVLLDALASLPLEGYTVEITDVMKSGLRACDFNVLLDAAHENHDHDMEYLYGEADGHSHEHAHNSGHQDTHTPGHDAEHTHIHEHIHDSEHGHTHAPGHAAEHAHAHAHAHESEHTHTHPHHHDARNLNDIMRIIDAAHLTDGARALAVKIFRILAEAEAQVHGKRIDEVHFHEVGAVDSIVDIVAAAVCLDNLQPDSVVVSPLTEGHGQIRCQHGLIPVPVPATAAIAASARLTLKPSNIEGELVTPTGAAIAAAVSSGAALPEQYHILRTGLGAGKRDYHTTNVLRAMLLEPADTDIQDSVVTLETNIDDSTGEALSFTMQQLLDTGALDAFCIPIYMKKNRPAVLLKVICQESDRTALEAIIFRNTTTIGIRRQTLQRTKLDRRILAVETPWGMADVKCCSFEGRTCYYPENDSVCTLAKNNGIGFSEMYGLIQSYVRETDAS